MAEIGVAGQAAQPNTAGSIAGNALGLRHKDESGDTNGLLYRAPYIIFAGQLQGTTIELEVFPGEAAPTPSGGYAKWAKIPRPQRVAFTVLEGYDPFTFRVPILFDAVRENGLQEDCENKIQWLEWMGGRGIKQSKGFTPGLGKPPLLQVYAASGADRTIPIIPAPFQNQYVQWFIDDIQWADSPPDVVRSAGGARIRQAAVVQLQQYVKDPILPPEASEGRARPYKITHALWCVQKLVASALAGTHESRRLGEAVAATIARNKGNRKIGTNPHKRLPVGTVVYIPAKYLSA